ncbi:hypothetical protein CEF21_17780 [Bacillus sp. FJAT-42376]|nr:hypothetical protein CEF21_17780 [Bacillus sp. FJAT-42376]
MKSFLSKAILNNIDWCRIVSESHGAIAASADSVWGLYSKAPDFYPEIISFCRDADLAEVNDFIKKGHVSSMKDSYADLNLSPLGFEILFEAEWIYQEPAAHRVALQSGWKVIATEHDLQKWTLTNGLENVIKPGLLKNKDVKIFMHETNDEISGFIANRSHDVVGISNVLSPKTADGRIWGEIPGLAAAEFPGLPMAGYEHDDDLIQAQLSGWKSLGPVRIWLKSDR